MGRDWRGYGFGFAEKYLLLVLGIAGNMALSRLLTPADVGLYALAAVFSGLAHVLRDLGTGQLLVADPQLDPQRQRSLLTLGVASGWLLALLLVLAAGPLAALYRQPALAGVLRVLALNFAITPFSAQVLAMLRRALRIGSVCAVNTVHGTVHFASSIALAWAGYGAYALAWATVAAALAAFLCAWLLRPEGMQWRPSLRHTRAVLGKSAWLTAGNVVDELGVSAPQLIAGKWLGIGEVALFSKAQGVLSLFNQAVTSAVSPTLYAVLARRARAGEAPLQAYLQVTANVTALAWPFFLYAALYAPLLVELLYGNQWHGCVPLIRIMCGATALYSIFSMARHLALACGHVGDQSRLDMHAVAVRLPLLLAGAMQGLAWLAAAVSASLVYRSWLTYRQLRRLFGLDWRRQSQPLRQSAIATLCAGLPPWLAGAPGPGWAPLLGAGLGVCAWCLALAWQRHPLAALLQGRRGPNEEGLP